MPFDSPRIWSFASFTYDEPASRLSQNGKPLPAEPQSLRLLSHLIRNRDRVVGRAELVDEIWHGRAVSDWAISGAVTALRRVLESSGDEGRIIRTVHSRGYRFVAEATAYTPEIGGGERPLALVRLFRDTGGKDEAAHLAEGLCEDVVTGLSRSPDWRVLSFNTTRALGDAADPKRHGARMVVDGGLRRVGGAIRINLSLSDAEGRQSWAETFDLTEEKLLARHDLIIDRLLAALSPGRSRPQGRTRATTRSEAYDLYQKGRYAYFRYDPRAFIEALSHFEAAAECDPGYADAYAQQAYCRTTLHVFGLPSADATLDPAEALARKAISINDAAALGHARLGWTLGYRGAPDQAVAAFEAALARDPDNAEAYHAYGETMNRLARPREAEPLLDMVFSKDAFFPPSWEFPKGHTRILLGDHGAAIRHFRSVLERVDRFIPARVQIVRALWESGERDAARENLARICDAAPRYGLAHAARMFPYPVEAEATRLADALKAAGMQ